MTFDIEIHTSGSSAADVDPEESKDKDFVDGENDADRLLNLTEIPLEAIKCDLIHTMLVDFEDLAKEIPLIELTYRTTSPFFGKDDQDKETSTFTKFLRSLEYVQRFLQAAKPLIPNNIISNLGENLLERCEMLVKIVLQEYLSRYAKVEMRSRRDHFVEYVILPVIQVINDFLELDSEATHNMKNQNLRLIPSSSIFFELGKFAICQEGVSLDRPHFQRVLALCQKLVKYTNRILKDTDLMNEHNALSSGIQLRSSQLEAIENILCSTISSMLTSENGRSFIKFWGEQMSTGLDIEKKIPECLNQINSLNGSPELYVIFTRYIGDKDNWFWRSNVGKAITPMLIQSIQRDLLSADKKKADTRKRAAFVLKGITTMYSLRNPVFDPDIPEVSSITLNNMDLKLYSKFWAYFFELHDILDETQIHIVQPILSKLNIFQEHSHNNAVYTWLPILLTKMILHDNRAIVKEGFERFLQTGQYLKLRKSSAYREIAQEFLDKYVMNIIKEHVAWVFNDPEEFLKNIQAFGTFLNELYSAHTLPHFMALEKVLTFLTSSGKCMSSHSVFFFIASVEQAMVEVDHSEYTDKIKYSDDIVSAVDSSLTLLVHLLSASVTTVSRYFREQLEYRCINLFSNITRYILHFFPEVDTETPVLLRLLGFLGSLSGKIVSETKAEINLQGIIEVYLKNGNGMLHFLLSRSNAYDFAKKNLSSTSVIGLFRFLSIAPKYQVFQETDERFNLTKTFDKAVSNFAECCTVDLINGSTQGIREYYERNGLVRDQVPECYLKMEQEVLGTLETLEPTPAEDFMNCIRRLEILSSLPKSQSFPTRKINIGEQFANDPAKIFLLRKLYTLNPQNGNLENVEKVHKLGDFNQPPEQETCLVFDQIEDQYFEIADRNILAEFYRLKFFAFKCVLNHRHELDDKLQLQMLTGVLDTVEKCDPKGAAEALLLAKNVMKFLNEEQKEYSNIVTCLQSVASVSWSLVFELRKSEAFWHLLQAFIEFICDPVFVLSGDLNKYADLIIKEGEMIWGLPFIFVQQLVKVRFPLHVLDKVNHILVKAALAGAPLPKNHRMSFFLWDYLTDTKEGRIIGDPENFSSDCKARILASRQLYINFDLLVSNPETKAKGEELLLGIVTEILDMNDEESQFRKQYFGGSNTHRRKQRIFQCLLLLQPYFNYEISEVVLRRTLACLSTDSPQPSVRYFGEWLVVRVVEKHPKLNILLFECLNDCINTRIGFGAFFATICLHVSKVITSSEFYDKALKSLAMLTLNQHVTVRIYSQIAFQKIFTRAEESKLGSLVEKYSSVLEALQSAILHVSGNCSKLLKNVSRDFYVNFFDTREHYCPEVIFSLLPRLAGMIKDECILPLDSIRALFPTESSKCELIVVGAGVLKDLERVYMDNEKCAWHLKAVVTDGRELGEEYPVQNYTKKVAPLKETDDEEMNYQKKINPWKLLSVSDEIEEYTNYNMKKRCVNEEGLIVVASLLENMPNLGGLCRTCEIFGVQKYVVNTLKVINDQQFQNLSVSAQNWVNILEVPVRDLEKLLLGYSEKGYAIYAIEQAQESSSLTNVTFPKKAVLLLGNEKQGIPTELLHLVDKCIEIPQVGIIRSLNVHVTGALCIWQYAMQHTF